MAQARKHHASCPVAFAAHFSQPAISFSRFASRGKHPACNSLQRMGNPATAACAARSELGHPAPDVAERRPLSLFRGNLAPSGPFNKRPFVAISITVHIEE
jgi:hypothetical protein